MYNKGINRHFISAENLKILYKKITFHQFEFITNPNYCNNHNFIVIQFDCNFGTRKDTLHYDVYKCHVGPPLHCGTNPSLVNGTIIFFVLYG